MSSRLTLSNRAENVKLLQDFVCRWARERGLSEGRRHTLEKLASDIFEHLVNRAYPSGRPGSIAVVLEEKGPRIRLMFEDDAPAYDPLERVFQGTARQHILSDQALAGHEVSPPADSLIFYRTADRKNRLVVFLTL